jgi:hypothetical protein
VTVRRALVAVALLAAAAGVFFLRTRPHAATNLPPETTAAVASAAPPPRPPRSVTLPPAADAADAAPLTEANGLAEVERAEPVLQAHGRACWERRTPLPTAPGAPDETTQSTRLHVRITVAAGEAHVELVDVADDKLQNASLRDCLLEGLDELHWPTSGPPGVVELRELFRMGDYTVPVGPPHLAPGEAPPGIVPPELRVPRPPQ